MSIANIVHTLLNNNLNHYVQRTGDTDLAVVLEFPKSEASAKIKKSSMDLCASINTNVRNLPYTVSTGIGGIYDSIMDLKLSYNEAKENLNFKIYFGNDGLVSSNDENERIYNKAYVVERTKSIMKSIADGNIDKTKELTRSFIKDISNQITDLEQAKKLYKIFIDIFIEKMISMRINEEDISFADKKYLDKDFEVIKAVSQASKYTQLFCNQALDLIDVYSKKAYYKHIDRAKEYVANNYFDIGLSLNMVAEYVGINQSYLCRLFKENMNENFVDYISQYRVEKAQQLLDSTNLTVKEVGYKVGFNSMPTFFRVFKKCNGKAACISVFYAIFVCIFIYKTMKPTDIITFMRDSVRSYGPMCLLLAFAIAFGRTLTLLRAPQQIASFMQTTFTNKYTFLLALDVVMLIIGMFMDTGSAIALLSPMLLPTAVAMGVNPVDLAGVNIRVMENPVSISYWKAWGANPTPIAFSELYIALQQKLVDAQENPLDVLLSSKLYEQQKYVIETNHMMFYNGIWMNLDFYNNLPTELQEMVTSVMKEVDDYVYNDAIETEKASREELKNLGIEFITLPESDLIKMRDAATETVKIVRESAGDEIVDLSFAIKTYLGGFNGDRPSYYAVPNFADDFSGLPPTLIIVGEYDPLRDDGLEYANHLLKDAVPCELYMMPRVGHAFDIVNDAPMTKWIRDGLCMSFQREFKMI